MARTTYIARFSDGTEIKRTTETRVYTHAYRCWGTCSVAGRKWVQSGFSSSSEQAAINMNGETAYMRRTPGYTFE